MLDFFRGKVTPIDWAIVAGIVVVALLLFSAFYLLVYGRQEHTLAGIDAELKTIRGQLKLAYDTKANSEQLQKEFDKMKALVDLFQHRLPDEREIPSLLRKFEALGDSLGLRVELSALPSIRDPNKETIPYRVKAWGSFHQIASFINLLERDDRYLKVSDVDIGAEESGVSESTFTLSTFRFLQAPAPAPAVGGGGRAAAPASGARS